MFYKDVTVENQVGLHARPATFFIQKANEFKSSIWVEKEERRVNAKSLLGVLSLGIVGGTTIRVIADGQDEEYVLAAITGGFKTLGFSDHTPYFFPGEYYSHMRMYPPQLPEYVKSVLELREKYADQINIKLGLEVEYYPDLFHKILPLIQENGIEYMILKSDGASLWREQLFYSRC